MNQPLFLLDTNIVLALVRGGALGGHIEQRFGLRKMGRRPLISIVTHGEVRVLAACNAWGEAKLGALRNALDELVSIDINSSDVLDAYVQIEVFSRAYAAGARPMGKNDVWIAACAMAAGATLLTTDKDFSHLHQHLLEVATIEPTMSAHSS